MKLLYCHRIGPISVSVLSRSEHSAPIGAALNGEWQWDFHWGNTLPCSLNAATQPHLELWLNATYKDDAKVSCTWKSRQAIIFKHSLGNSFLEFISFGAWTISPVLYHWLILLPSCLFEFMRIVSINTSNWFATQNIASILCDWSRMCVCSSVHLIRANRFKNRLTITTKIIKLAFDLSV